MLRNKSLLALALGGFGIGMTEFVMMGLLPDISHSLAITIPQAGHLISLYALGVVVGAPLIAAVSGKFKPNRLLMGLMAFFAVAHVLAALAPNYQLLMLARFVAGLPHGAFFGVGAVVASRLAAKGKSAQAISVMFAGLTTANVIGVPLGTYLGHAFNWRIVMGIIAVIGVMTLLAVRSWLPQIAGNAAASFRNDLKIFAHADTWFSMCLASIGFGGFFAWFSYIAPLAMNITQVSAGGITVVLVIAGLGMTFGNSLGGILADRFSPIKSVVALLIAMTTCLLLMSLAAPYYWAFLFMTFTTGTIAFAGVAPMQMVIIKVTEGSEMLGSSLGQAGFNVGNALGAYLGGLPLVYGYGYLYPQVVGAGLAFTGVVISSVMMWRAGRAPALRA